MITVSEHGNIYSASSPRYFKIHFCETRGDGKAINIPFNFLTGGEGKPTVEI